MYTNDVKPANIETVKAEILRRFNSYFSSKQKANVRAEKYISFEEQIERAAGQFMELNDAILAGRSVWADCEKWPTRLENGRHYYSVLFVNKAGRVQKFWPMWLAPAFGMDEQNRNRDLSKWVFSSGAIGMSRVLDATDPLGNFSKAVGAGYFQLDSSF